MDDDGGILLFVKHVHELRHDPALTDGAKRVMNSMKERNKEGSRKRLSRDNNFIPPTVRDIPALTFSCQDTFIMALVC